MSCRLVRKQVMANEEFVDGEYSLTKKECDIIMDTETR